MTDRMVQGSGVPQADGSMKIEARMAADDVGRAVVYMASLPLDTNVLFMTVMANMMPFVGRG
jgi:NADP-dependent 3-hydroxy acid dehydrogenase YdfG